MNRIRLFRLAATLAVPLTILAGAVIPAHASPGTCDFHGCAATTHLSSYQGGFGAPTNPNARTVTRDYRIWGNPDKAKVWGLDFQ
ncbi:MAG: hypothetical protein ACYDBJ_03270 [Aggregatilineales bacterium]